MYSENDRHQTEKTIVELFSPLKEINAIFLVGSNARGKADIYSDVDISIIVEDDFVRQIWEKAESLLISAFSPFKHFMQYYNENSFLIGLCLKNGLEIDIGFCNQEQFIKQKTTRKGMDSVNLYSKEDFSLPPLKLNLNNNVSELLEKRINDMWYDFTNTIIALKRGQIFRSANGIESIRSQLIEIYAKANELEHKHYRHVDQLDEKIKADFIATFSPATYDGFKSSLLKLIEIFINILKEFNHSSDAEEYKQHFDNFIKDVDL